MTAEDPTLLPEHTAFVSQDSKGRFLLASRRLDQLLVFTPNGLLTGFVGGSAGSSRFRMVTSFFVRDDGMMFVYDMPTRTLNEVGPDLRPRSSRTMPYRPSLALSDGSFIVTQQMSTAERAGQPVHLIDAQFRVVSSFGSVDGRFRVDEPLLSERVAALGSDESVWVAHKTRYLLEQWNPSTAAMLKQFAVKSSLFEADGNATDFTRRPRSIIQGFWESKGWLWVLLRVADKNWRPPKPGIAEQAFELGDYERTYDSILEVVDMNSGLVVATRRFDNALWGRAPSEFLTSQTYSSDGKNRSVDVWQFEVRRKEKNK